MWIHGLLSPYFSVAQALCPSHAKIKDKTKRTSDDLLHGNPTLPP